jgi:acetyl esterase/lipase
LIDVFQYEPFASPFHPLGIARSFWQTAKIGVVLKNMLTMSAGVCAVVASAFTAAIAGPINFTDLLARPRETATERVRYGDAPSQFADLWMPSASGSHPVVVLIHGGCWRADLPGLEMMTYAAADLRRRGVAVWNIEYRRLGEAGGGYPGTFVDVANAVDWLRKLASDKKLDLRNVVAVGHSAGGHLALWAAARRRLPKSSSLARGNPLLIKAVVSLAGIADLSAYRAEGPLACGGPRVIDLLDGTASRGPWDVFKDTSPAEMLPIGVPQAIISGALDPIVPAAFGRAYAAKASAAGDPVQEITLSDAGHFELIDPESHAFETVRSAIARFQAESLGRSGPKAK